MSPFESKVNKDKSRFAAIVEFGLYHCVIAVFRILPLKLAYFLAETLVRLGYSVSARLRRRVFEHLEICFGRTANRAELEALYLDSVRYHAWFWVDMFLGPRLLRNAKLAARVDISEAVEALDRLGWRHNCDRGVLLVSSHQGSPDIITLALGAAGIPMAAIARPLDNPRIAKSVQKARANFPRTEIDKNGGLRTAFRHLKKGGIVGVQVDQDAGVNGVFVPYFEKLASTHTGPGMLATLSNCPVVMIYAIRTAPRSFEYKLFAKVLEAPSFEVDTDAAVLEWTRRMTTDVEAMAKRFPEQVLWAHRRWKTRPSTRKTKAAVLAR